MNLSDEKYEELLPSIIIVDDDKIISNRLSSFFSNHGNRVSVINEPLKAASIIANFKPEILFLDLKMPKLGGLKLLDKIRSICFSTEIIVVTASADLNTAIDSIRLGARDYLPKPFTDEQLLSAYDRALERILLKKGDLISLNKTQKILADLIISVSKEKRELVLDIRRKMESLVFPQLEYIIANSSNQDTNDALVFTYQLLDSILPNDGSGDNFYDVYKVLSPAEREVCKYVMQGCGAQNIADKLCKSIDTIYGHQKKIRKKLNLPNSGKTLSEELLKLVGHSE